MEQKFAIARLEEPPSAVLRPSMTCPSRLLADADTRDSCAIVSEASKSADGNDGPSVQLAPVVGATVRWRSLCFQGRSEAAATEGMSAPALKKRVSVRKSCVLTENALCDGQRRGWTQTDTASEVRERLRGSVVRRAVRLTCRCRGRRRSGRRPKAIAVRRPRRTGRPGFGGRLGEIHDRSARHLAHVEPWATSGSVLYRQNEVFVESDAAPAPTSPPPGGRMSVLCQPLDRPSFLIFHSAIDSTWTEDRRPRGRQCGSAKCRRGHDVL